MEKILVVQYSTPHAVMIRWATLTVAAAAARTINSIISIQCLRQWNVVLFVNTEGKAYESIIRRVLNARQHGSKINNDRKIVP